MNNALDGLLRQHRPAIVAVFSPDQDEPQLIRPTGQRGRWLRVLGAVSPDATRAELRDESGAVLAACQLDGVSSQPLPPPLGGSPEQLERLLALLLRAQESAVDRQQRQLSDLTSGYRELAQLVVGRLSSLERTYSDVLRSAYEATAIAAQANAAPEQSVADTLVAQLAPMAAAKLAGMT